MYKNIVSSPSLLFDVEDEAEVDLPLVMLGGGTAEPSGGLADTVYMESRR